ncbi:MAG: caspase family protein, partial [Fischerella sp.]|nr:caspase family protein [Fischerella sp.]
MKRRTFLQRFGSILAALGIAEAEWFNFGTHYQQALAQPSPRKLALLVGINQYPESPALNGCLVDVELQREVLIHRFGFQPSNILSLTDEQASREVIESAFLEHLVQQAKAGDVIVFHFSGYGSRIALVNSQETVQNALIPADGFENTSQQTQTVNCLLEETLLLMLRSLPTEKVTAVLDTSYYAPTNFLPAGHLRVRARQMPTQAVLADAELDFQKRLQEKAATELPAVVMSATSNPNQLAQEIQLSGFSAGLFTYALTQYLWETTPAVTIPVFVSRVGSTMQQVGSLQQPGLLTGKKNLQRVQLSENLPPEALGAEGVVTAIEEDGKVQVWLAGLPPQVLEYYGVNSRLTLVNQAESNTELILRSRSGLTAKTRIVSSEGKISPQVGQLVQEAVRVLPRNINLTVALDPGLERIERVDATSAFATVANVSSVVAGEQPADYVFGKLPDAKSKDLIASTSLMVSPSRYGLFSLGSEQIPNTLGEAGEAVKVAVQRLDAKLQTLLAAKLWRLTDNEGSSHLNVKASLEIINGIAPRVVMQRETQRPASAETSSKKLVSHELGHVPTVSIGSRVQYRVQNMSNNPVYFMLLGLNSARNAIALFPWQKVTETDGSPDKPLLNDIVIAPGETLTLPQTTAGFEWVIQG